MELSRQLELMHGPEVPGGAALRVAFASTDGVRVDQHFGAAFRFFVYRVSKATAVPVTIGEFATTESGSEGSRLRAKVAWLSSCDVIYACALGSSANRKLLARGVLALRTASGSTIRSLVELLQSELADPACGWLVDIERLRGLVGVSDSEHSDVSQED